MAYSHTRLQLVQQCGQRYRYRYQNGIKERPSAASRPLILGSAVHAGIEEYLRAKTERPTLTPLGLLTIAQLAAQEYVKGETQPNVRKYVDGKQVFDTTYYEMMREAALAASTLLMHYIPTIPDSWRIATKRQVIPSRYPADDRRGDELALEWQIRYTFPGGQEFTGVVDAVILDIETGMVTMVDWKVKGQFPMDDKAMLDGQLHLYAAVLNAAGANIREVCMYQMKSEGPAVAELGQGAKNKGQVLTGRDSYATTWEYWCETLPMGVDPKKYEATMKPKMKTIDYFIRPVTSPVTRYSSEFALDNAYQAVKMIENDALPAVLSAYTCNFCPFWRLCDAKRYGGNLDMLIDMAYDRETLKEDEDV